MQSGKGKAGLWSASEAAGSMPVIGFSEKWIGRCFYKIKLESWTCMAFNSTLLNTLFLNPGSLSSEDFLFEW